MSVAAVVLFSLPATATSYATKVIEYRPAPGQFMNLEITTDTSGALGPVGGSDSADGATEGIVSLGAFGGYIILGFDQPIVNDPQHPYGVDFTIIGNAISADGVNASCEPAAVAVMADLNGNGIPDDGEWFELAGSDYWLASTRKNLAVTYTNPLYNNANSVPWQTSDNTTGALLANDSHTQQYYPDTFLFPQFDIEGYTLTGNCIEGSLNKSNPSGVKVNRAPAFGYADSHGTPGNFNGASPNNPYYADDKGPVTDGFDLSWAVDANGNYIDLQQVDFIKIYTAGQGDAGWLGEWSSEIDGVVLSEPDPDYIPTDYYLHYIAAPQAHVALGTTCRFEGKLFKNGRPCNEGKPTYTLSDPTVGTISDDGLFTPLREGVTDITFSQLDGVTPDRITVAATTLTGVLAIIDGEASAVASTTCIAGEKMFIEMQSTDNGPDIVAGSTGNRYTHDTYTWYNSNPAVGTVDSFGTFHAIAAGSTVLSAVSQTDPSLYAEVKVTVRAVPAVALNKPSMQVTYTATAGNWLASALFKTTNRSSVVINSVTARNGLFPCSLQGNRVVYDCSGCTESIDDILDFDVTYYGTPRTFSLPVSYVADTSGIIATETGCAPAATCHIYTTSGIKIAETAPENWSDGLPGGIYIIRTVNADGSVTTTKAAVQ